MRVIHFFSDPPGVPTISGWPSNSTINVGEKLDLACNAANNGGTPTSFEWYKDNVQQSSDQKYEVTIDDTILAGDYECKATNADGSTKSVTRTLIVLGELHYNQHTISPRPW